MTWEQFTYLTSKAGFAESTLSAIFFFGLILSPFPRFLVVLGAMRIGLRGFPGTIVTVALAGMLAFAQMSPVLTKIGSKAFELSPSRTPLSADKSTELLNYIEVEWMGYISPRTKPEMKTRVAGAMGENSASNMLAFFLGELEQAMKISIVLLLPLLVIDLLCSTAISALGIESLRADVVSFPLKIALILSTSGWTLIGENLLKSYGQ